MNVAAKPSPKAAPQPFHLPQRPTQAGLAGTHDPNYQVMLFLPDGLTI